MVDKKFSNEHGHGRMYCLSMLSDLLHHLGTGFGGIRGSHNGRESKPHQEARALRARVSP